MKPRMRRSRTAGTRTLLFSLALGAFQGACATTSPWVATTTLSEPLVMKVVSSSEPSSTSVRLGDEVVIHYSPPRECKTTTTARESVTSYSFSGREYGRSFLFNGPLPDPRPRTETVLVDWTTTRSCLAICSVAGRRVLLAAGGETRLLGFLAASGELVVALSTIAKAYPRTDALALLTSTATSIVVEEDDCDVGGSP